MKTYNKYLLNEGETMVKIKDQELIYIKTILNWAIENKNKIDIDAKVIKHINKFLERLAKKEK